MRSSGEGEREEGRRGKGRKGEGKGRERKGMEVEELGTLKVLCTYLAPLYPIKPPIRCIDIDIRI